MAPAPPPAGFAPPAAGPMPPGGAPNFAPEPYPQAGYPAALPPVGSVPPMQPGPWTAPLGMPGAPGFLADGIGGLEEGNIVPQGTALRRKSPGPVKLGLSLCLSLAVILVIALVFAHKTGDKHGDGAVVASEGRGTEGASSAGPASSASTAAPEAEAPPSTSSAPEAAASTSAAATTSSSADGPHKCYNLYSNLDVNPLQKYPENPDSQAYGFATCKLCTNSSMSCKSLLHSGKSNLIASHIHFVSDEAGKDGTNGEGPPVINFCGSNDNGMINDGTDYTQPCEQWSADGSAHNVAPGVLIASQNKDKSLRERLEDIAARPEMYYFNYHTLASWNHWYPSPHGICRGALKLTSTEE